MAAVLSAALALGAVAVARSWGGDDDAPPPPPDPVPAAYAAWRSGPARGALAGDQVFTDAALAAWAAHPAPANRPDQAHLADHALGPARIAWAGTVAGEPTAVVFQEATVTEVELPGLDEGAGGPSDLWGFLRPDPDGLLRVIAVSAYIGDAMPTGRPLGAWVDVERAIALLLDLGAPMQMSPALVSGPDGLSREYEPVEFGPDGAAIIDVDESGPGEPYLSAVFVRSDVTRVRSYGLPGPLPSRQGPATNGLALDWASGVDSDAATLVPIFGLGPPPVEAWRPLPLGVRRHR